MAKVAFLGLGVMGREMALRLVKAGHAVAVYNRTAAKTKPLLAAGARAAPTPADAAKDAEVVISMVGDDAASRAVWLGPDGALAASSPPGALAIESATLTRAWVIELAAAARRHGFDFLDCPVTGGPDGARDGRLTLLVGGAPATFERAWPVLSAYAGRALRFGPVGAGTAYKTVANLMGAVQAVALAEGLLTAERADLDMGAVAEALTSGAVASPLVKYLVGRMTAGNHDDVYFATRWRLKDAAYGLKLAAEIGQATPVSALAAELFRLAVARGWGDKNESVAIETLR